ncbi:hypothetical protein EAH73_13815 [Hymenobacter nivis]|uniref:Uncharacterized protein n=2 Tax=Hymenobacter nivis TaxID=1850093 RepID=A0A502GVP5_9BACT|nr:hypothetical protein EAH73_13815 [Hymenobacter nivis]
MGCNSTSIVRAGFQVPAVQEMAFVSPITTIAVVRYNNPGVIDKEATIASESLLHEALVRRRAQLRLRNEVTVPDSLLTQARREVYRAVAAIEEHWQLASGADLPALDYLLSRQDQRYALILAASGFTRIPKLHELLNRPYMARIGYLVVDKYNRGNDAGRAKSKLFLFIYDTHQKAIVYYAHTPPLNDFEPLDAASLEKQLSKLLKRDFSQPNARN